MNAALRWLHRWLGLTTGLLFTAVALSGSLLLFQPQFFEWAHGDVIPDDLAQEPGSVDAWVANASAVAPVDGQLIAVWRPHVAHNVSAAAMLVYTGLEPGGLGNMGFAGVLIAPKTGAVLDVFNIDRSPAYAPIFFHRDLWAGESGRIVSGVMAIFTLLALLLGLYLWWPSKKYVWRKLSPRPWRVTFSRAVPLHDFTGIWLLAALLVLVVSGLYLVRPAWVEPALGLLPGTHESEEHQAAACDDDRNIGFDTALEKAKQLVPNGTWRAIYPHDAQFREWEITFKTGNDTDTEHGDTHVLANLSCGTVELHETAQTRSPRATTEAWLVGLHDGSVFGLPGEIVVALLGLAPLVLAWSGILMWLRNR